MRGVTAVVAAATEERLVLKEKATQIYEKKKWQKLCRMERDEIYCFWDAGDKVG